MCLSKQSFYIKTGMILSKWWNINVNGDFYDCAFYKNLQIILVPTSYFVHKCTFYHFYDFNSAPVQKWKIPLRAVKHDMTNYHEELPSDSKSKSRY